MSGWRVLFVLAAMVTLVSGSGAVGADEAAGPVARGRTGAGVTLDFARDWRIVAPSNERVARTAAAEAALVLERITRKRIPFAAREEAGVPAVVLSHGPRGDGFTWRATAGRVEIKGDGPRGLLYGVYDFLESLGCRWVEPGSRGERLPSGTSLHPSRTFSRQTPYASATVWSTSARSGKLRLNFSRNF